MSPAAALLAGVTVLLALGAAVHALLTKPDPRSAGAWVVVCCAFPLLGPAFYVLLGINRVRARARELAKPAAVAPVQASVALSGRPAAQIARSGDEVTQWPRVGGNRIDLLTDAGHAFEQMLAAIAGARNAIWLATYLFDFDGVGKRFVAALAAAAGRGVQVRVLVDGIGEWYSWPRAVPRQRISTSSRSRSTNSSTKCRCMTPRNS